MSKELEALFISSIIIPVAVLAGLRLTGLTPGPIIVSETITAPGVEWEVEKPSYQDYSIHHEIENSYNTTEIAALTNVFVWRYDYIEDEFTIMVNGAASVPHGHIAEVSVEFHGNDYSVVQLWRSESEFKNLSLVEHEAWNDDLTGDLKAFVNLISPNNSRSVSFQIYSWFLVNDGAINPNPLQVSMQFIYFNGTIYKGIVLPTIFTVMTDAGGSFESARLIEFGNYSGFIDYLLDNIDYYKIWLDADQTVRVKLFIPEPEGSWMNLYFYDPNRNLVSNSTTKGTTTNTAQIEYDVLQSGYWYIRAMDPLGAHFLYVLSVEKIE